MRILETFQCFVDKFDGDIAYVTLTPEKGDKLIGEIPVATLEEFGIKENRRFICRTVEVEKHLIRIEYEAIPDRVLTEEEERKLNDKICKAIGFDMQDDY